MCVIGKVLRCFCFLSFCGSRRRRQRLESDMWTCAWREPVWTGVCFCRFFVGRPLHYWQLTESTCFFSGALLGSAFFSGLASAVSGVESCADPREMLPNEKTQCISGFLSFILAQAILVRVSWCAGGRTQRQSTFHAIVTQIWKVYTVTTSIAERAC